ncbi:MAG: FkbM family methyltransferase [Sphingobacteriales bacterium]|nr:FkbM family methyltransferase [Sphingobacteriales bacterium]
MKNKLLKLSLYWTTFGILPGTWLLLKIAFSSRNKIISLSPPGFRFPIYIRAHSSDEYTFQQIFIQKEYAFPIDKKISSILDAGANIGLAAIFFAQKFPEASILCLEPEPGNFQLLQKNTEHYPNIIPVQAGLWSKSAFLQVIDEGLDNWGFTVKECREDTPGAISAVSIADLLARYSRERFDLVKLDIEGSEKEILDAPDSANWLAACSVLVIELHDRMKPGTSASLFKAVRDKEYLFDVKGENLLFHFKNGTA